MDFASGSDPDELVNYATPTAAVSLVMPHVFVGTFMSEQNRGLLVSNNITHILQIGSELQPSHPEEFSYASVSCYDKHTEDITRMLRPCLEFIDAAVLSGGSVLVHCMAGVSRSPAVCCAYIMWKRQLSLADAMQVVVTAHPTSNPNAVFMAQLKLFETDMHANINQLPPTPLDDILNKGQPSDDLDCDADDDSDLERNLTEEDWL